MLADRGRVARPVINQFYKNEGEAVKKRIVSKKKQQWKGSSQS